MAITLVSWNIGKRDAPWRELVEMGADVALLQEADSPPDDIAGRIETGPRDHWDSHGWNSGEGLFDRWPMVVKLSDRVEVEWSKQIGPISATGEDEIAVSGIGTLAAARIIPQGAAMEPFIVVSMYGRWIEPHRSTRSGWGGYADGSAHRIISDLSAFIGRQRGHRILAAGDLNILHGYGENGSKYWARRYDTVFARMEALGLPLLGPQSPHGRQAEPWPDELPRESLNVPTYYRRGQSPATAQRQLDYAFASRGFDRSVSVRAMNAVEEWGESDHCRLLIEVAVDDDDRSAIGRSRAEATEQGGVEFEAFFEGLSADDD